MEMMRSGKRWREEWRLKAREGKRRRSGAHQYAEGGGGKVEGEGGSVLEGKEMWEERTEGRKKAARKSYKELEEIKELMGYAREMKEPRPG